MEERSEVLNDKMQQLVGWKKNAVIQLSPFFVMDGKLRNSFFKDGFLIRLNK